MPKLSFHTCPQAHAPAHVYVCMLCVLCVPAKRPPPSRHGQLLGAAFFLGGAAPLHRITSATPSHRLIFICCCLPTVACAPRTTLCAGSMAPAHAHSAVLLLCFAAPPRLPLLCSSAITVLPDFSDSLALFLVITDPCVCPRMWLVARPVSMGTPHSRTLRHAHHLPYMRVPVD